MKKLYSIKIFGISLAAVLVLFAVVLPVCQSYMLEHAQKQHTEQAECCVAETESGSIMSHHVAYFKTTYTGLPGKNLAYFVIALAFAFLAIFFVRLLPRDNNFQLVKWKQQYTFALTHILQPLRIAYARGLIQSKHLH